MSQIDTLQDAPRVSLKEGVIGTTDERGFTYIAPNVQTALLLGFDAEECWLMFREKAGYIIQLDADQRPTRVTYCATDVAHCLEILELIRQCNYRHLVRSVGRTQCRRWGFSV